MKVAILGCSHSDTMFVRDNWVEQLSRKYPDIQFDNYSIVGGGQLDIDCILKHFVKFKMQFDKVIVQFSGNNRWIIPSQGVWRDFEDPYDRVELSNNLHCYRLDVPRARSSRIFTKDELKGIAKGFWSEGHVHVDNFRVDDWACRVGFGHYYSDLVHNTMAEIYPYDFLYWTWRQLDFWANNLGHDICAHDWFLKNHKKQYTEEWTDDTLHLTPEGNRVLLEEYLGNHLTNHLESV